MSEYENNLLKFKNNIWNKNNRFNNNVFVINNISNSTERIKIAPNLTVKSHFDKGESFKNKINETLTNKNHISLKNGLYIEMKQYMETEFDDMVFDDVIERDKRKFCQYFSDNLKTNLLLINTFCNKEPFRPITIKILLFILDIDLYLFVNALFINEDFVSQIFYSTKKENFFSFLSRSFDRVFYTTLVGVIVNYIIECFFIDEKIIKGIFKRGKNELFSIKAKIHLTLKNILKRLIYFIIICFIITIFTLYYISCFNYIYPHMKLEWIKSSIFIIIITQIFSSLLILFESIIRYISFLLKSEKIYKISLFLS